MLAEFIGKMKHQNDVGSFRIFRGRFFFKGFTHWLIQELLTGVPRVHAAPGVRADDLLVDGVVLAYTLKAYGKVMFAENETAGNFGETINAVCDKARHLRPLLTPAWDIYGRWRDAEPSERRQVMPEPVLLAAVCVTGGH